MKVKNKVIDSFLQIRYIKSEYGHPDDFGGTYADKASIAKQMLKYIELNKKFNPHLIDRDLQVWRVITERLFV